jgi:opacity protein-like surface antigen
MSLSYQNFQGKPLVRNLAKYSFPALFVIPAVAAAYDYDDYYDPPFFKQSLIQKADNTFYISLGGGGAYQQLDNWKADPGSPYETINDPDRNYAGAGVGYASIGYGFERLPIRAEFAYNYIGQSKYDWDNLLPFSETGNAETPADVRVNANTFMFNLYADFWVTDTIAPYITGGVGYSVNGAKLELTVGDTKLPSHTYNKGNFAWNAGVGLKYAISESWSAAAQINYVALGRVDIREENPTTGQDADFMHSEDLFSITGIVNIAYHF